LGGRGDLGGGACALPLNQHGKREVEHVLLHYQLTFNFFHVYISSEIIKLDGVSNIIILDPSTCSMVHNKLNLMLLIITMKIFEYYIIQEVLASKFLKDIIDA